MKTILKPFAFLSILSLLTACGGNGEEQAAPQSNGTNTNANADDDAGGAGGGAGETVKIGVSIPAADHGWTAGVGYWAREAMSHYDDDANIEWVYQTAQSPDQQVSQIEDMMAQGIDGLVILATESAPLTPVVKQADERGIFIVSVDRGLLEPVADIFLEGDNKAFGRKSAEYIVERLGGEGKIVILRGIPSTVDTDRYEAAMEVFNANPGVEVLASAVGMWNRERALSEMQALLTQHAEIDAVWASDDDMALGAEQAIKEAGREDEIWMLGGAGMKDIVKRVLDGDPMYPADITYPPAMIAAGVHLAVANLAFGGDEVSVADRIPAHLFLDESLLRDGSEPAPQGQRHIKLDVHLITPENAEEFYFPESVY